jgi:cytoskeletal protein CcmA (bactofilin family)
MRRRDREAGPGAVEPGEAWTNGLGPEMTIVGRGAELEGTLVSTESIRIDGQARGTIAARGDVIVSADSHVEADIHARNVVTAGVVKGSITAETRTELAQGGRMEGRIRSRFLVVKEGALFDGHSSTGVDAPGEADEAAFPEDDLQAAYEEATRRATEWFTSRLGPVAGPDRGPAEQPDASPPSQPEEPEKAEGTEGTEPRPDETALDQRVPSHTFRRLTPHAPTERAPLRTADR